MTQRSPWMRWTWGLSVTGVFTWSWLILWGLIPGTPAADEVWVDSAVRFSIERESDGLLAGVLYGFEPIRKKDLEQAGSLTISETGNLAVLEQMPNVRRLRIVPDATSSGPSLELKKLPRKHQLEALSCSFTRLDRLALTSDFPFITDFSARNTPLRSLEGIERMPSLIHLDLGIEERVYNSISDPYSTDRYSNGPVMMAFAQKHQLITDPLAAEMQLQTLSLRGRWVNSLLPLTGLTKLRELDLGKCKLESINELAYLPGLKRVGVDRNNIRDLSPLLQLPALEEVTLMGNPQTDENIATFNTLKTRGVRIIDLPRKAKQP